MSDLQKAGRYEIIGRIGEGGFGVVYKGRDPFMKRLVAIKTCSSENDETRKRFLREAEIAGKIEHPNVTVLYDFGYEDDTPYLVQEFLTGADLDHRLREPDRLELPEKLDILLQMAQGLGFAHEHGITHRDIKPGNIRLTDEGRVKIMDFGIAKIASAESQLTQTGTTLGTPAYLSPEQLRGDPVDQRSDIYSYGVVAFELLSNRRMFQAETISALFFQILHEPPPKLSSVWPECPPELETIIEGCVQKRAEDRHPSFREVVLTLLPLIERYAENPSLVPPPPPPPPAKPIDPGTIAASERHAALEEARRRIEDLLASGQLQDAATALVVARRDYGDPLPLRALHERLVQLQTRAYEGSEAPPSPAAATVAHDVDALLVAGSTQQARAQLETARSEIGESAELWAAEQRVEALESADQAAGTLTQAQARLDAGDLEGAENLLDQARRLAPRTVGLDALETALVTRRAEAPAAPEDATELPTQLVERPDIATSAIEPEKLPRPPEGPEPPAATHAPPPLKPAVAADLTAAKAPSPRRWLLPAGLVAGLLIVTVVAISLVRSSTGRPDQAAQSLADGVVTLDVSPWGELIRLVDADGETLDFEGDFTPTRLSLPQGTYTATFENPYYDDPLEVPFEVGAEPANLRFRFGHVDVDGYFREAGLVP